MAQTTTPFIVQRRLTLALQNVEDSAGSFPGDLEGANVQIIIQNQDSSALTTVNRPLLADMPKIRQEGIDSSYLNGYHKVSGQGKSQKLVMIGGGWNTSGAALYDSAHVINSRFLDSDIITERMNVTGMSTKGDLDAASLTTLSTSTHTPLHRMTLDGHSSGTVADTSSRNWNRSLSTTTIGGKTAVNSNVSYNFGYLSGSNVNWPQYFTLFAIYYNKPNADDYWYNHTSSSHFVRITNTSNSGTTAGNIAVGGSSTYTITGAKVPKDEWTRIIITGSASSTSTAASTKYKVYVNGEETGSATSTGMVGYALKSGTSYNFAYSTYTTGYFLELGVISSVLNATQLAELDAHMRHRLDGSTAAFSHDFADSDKTQFTYSGDSSLAEMPMFNKTSAGTPPPFKQFDEGMSLKDIRIQSADTLKRNTVPATIKKIIVADSAGTTFIDTSPLDLQGDSALLKGEREHLFQRITTLTDNNDPRLVKVDADSVAAGDGAGPVQAWF